MKEKPQYPETAQLNEELPNGNAELSLSLRDTAQPLPMLKLIWFSLNQ